MSEESTVYPPPPVVAVPDVQAEPVPAPVPYAGPKHKTPKDMVQGLVLIREYKLLDDDAGDLEMGVITGIASTYVLQKRTGRTVLGWDEWYETADMEDVQKDTETAEKDLNPTTR